MATSLPGPAPDTSHAVHTRVTPDSEPSTSSRQRPCHVPGCLYCHSPPVLQTSEGQSPGYSKETQTLCVLGVSFWFLLCPGKCRLRPTTRLGLRSPPLGHWNFASVSLGPPELPLAPRQGVGGEPQPLQFSLRRMNGLLLAAWQAGSPCCDSLEKQGSLSCSARGVRRRGGPSWTLPRARAGRVLLLPRSEVVAEEGGRPATLDSLD